MIQRTILLGILVTIVITAVNANDTWSVLTKVLKFIGNLVAEDPSEQDHPKALKRGINGGFPCAACTVLLSIASQLTQIHNETTIDSLERICTYLPKSFQPECDEFVELVGPMIISQYVVTASPDAICYGIGLCYIDPGKRMCHLFPMPEFYNDVNFRPRMNQMDSETFDRVQSLMFKSFPWVCYIPGVSKLCEALDDTYDKLVPGIDVDNDRFSPTERLRGSIWRGRDCSDVDGAIYPGRRPINDDRFQDSNCNGIFGVNQSTGVAYEEELCGGSGQRGVIYIGDSVGAHFHVPPSWFRPVDLGTGILDNITYVISNEADWPDLGFAVGFRESVMPELIDGKVDSIYKRLRERNLCNHRDYQNLARNGADSNTTLDYMKSLSRSKHWDHPAVVFHALVGNDVCNEKPDTEKYMTPPEQFYNNTMNILRFLESHLAPGSHVILMGLIDGSILWDAMAHRIHPLGELRQDLKYSEVYDWFNCMEMGPCHGWMTTNSTLRKVTTKHARKLTRILKHIAEKEHFVNFDLHFMDNPFRTVINDWLDDGGEVWELIEPVDSLHPTQAAQALIAQSVWNFLEKNAPDVLGPVNERNEDIKRLFGNQGGH